MFQLFGDFLKIFDYSSLDDYFYYDMIHLFYYGYSINYSFENNSNIYNYNFNDFIFGTSPIRSYERSKRLLPSFTGNFYNYLRSTNVYNQNNKINNFTYFINYSDSQDVTSMLPEGTDIDYLSSPLFKDNENSSSKGYITYDIQEVIQGDKVIDYSKEDNSIHNNINNTYIENWVEGDNITITKDDNSSIDKILKTSEDILGILRLLYTSVLNIEAKMQNLGDNISNTTNNFSYNVKNEINRIVVPNSAIMKDKFTTIKTQSEEHLGIMYQGVDFLMFVGTLYAELDNPEVIILNIPEISLYDHVLIKETTFNFTNFMTKDLPFLSTIHNIYLTAVDLVFLCILIKFAEKVYDKYTGNGGN